MKYLFGILLSLALALTGCIFDSKESGTTFTAGYYSDFVDTIYAYEADGSRGAVLGIGFEWSSQNDQALEMWQDPEFERDPFFDLASDSVLSDSDSFEELMPVDSDSKFRYYVLNVAEDSTYLLTPADLGLLVPYFDTAAVYAGMPCTFSKPHAYQADSNGYYTIPLVVGKAIGSVTSARKSLSFLIDTAASKSADPRVRFADQAYRATVKVSCP